MAHGSRLFFFKLEVEPLPSDRCRCSVELSHEGNAFVGNAEGGGLEGELWCAAQAAADALGRVAGTSNAVFKLLDLKTVEMFDIPAVIIALSVHYQDDWQYLVGFSLAEDDSPRAAVRAVLNSTNRFFERFLDM